MAVGVGHIGVVLLLAPADPVRGHRTDEHFMAEAAAARDAGHDMALVGHDALVEPGVPGGRWPVCRRAAARRCTAGGCSAAALRRVRLSARVQFGALRGEEFTGGFVLRRFERFTSAEARTWWMGGTCRLIMAHPRHPARCRQTSAQPRSSAPSSSLIA